MSTSSLADESSPLAILLLEDSPRDAELVRARLARSGLAARVDWAATRQEFEAFLRAGAYDVVLADYNLPAFEGPAALHLAEALCPGAPFICVSGAIGEETVVELLKLGASDYVSKERLEGLARTIRRALEGRFERQQRLQAEAALHESEERFRLAFENAHAGICLVDLEGRILRSNRAMSEMMGYPGLEGLTVDDIAHPEDKGKTLDFMRRATAGDLEHSVFEKRYLHRDGRLLWGQVSSALVRDGQGAPRNFVSHVQDITARRKAEEALRVESAALDATANAVVITNREGRIEWVNPAFSTMTGFSSQEAVGQTPGHLVGTGSHPPGFFEELWRTILAGEVWRGEFVNRRKDGAQFCQETTITPVRGAAGEIAHFVAVEADVTERRRLEEELTQARKLDAIGRLAGGVAHDFNNTLAVVLGFAERGLARLQPGAPVRRDLEEIVRAVERSAHLTHQLLAFARKQVVLPVVLDLNDAIRRLEEALPRLIGEDIDLAFELSPGLWPVRLDASQLDQVLINLAANARDAIPGVGRITFRTANVALDAERVRAHLGAEPGEYVLLAVADSGQGMTEETLARIFEPYFTTKPAGKGTGLGLAIVYGIVRQAGGVIDVRSSPGSGTTFEIRWPRFSGAEERATAAVAKAPTAGAETVLVVEDDPGLLEVVRDNLESLGYSVLSAGTPGQAEELCARHPGTIHVLLSDVVMPHMNGRDLQSRLRRLRPDLRVVFMSGYTADVLGGRGFVEPECPFIQKPFTAEALGAKIREALAGSSRSAV